MSPRQVLFNGSRLVLPGAYSKVDASAFQNVALDGAGICCVVGEADDGPPRVLQSFRGADDVALAYRRGDVVEAAQILADPSNDDNIATGAQQIYVYKVNNSLPSSQVKAPHTFKSKAYGLSANVVATALAAGTTTIGRILTVTGLDANGNQVVEISNSLGETAKFTIAYVGAGSACTMTISATQLTTSVTGGPGGEDLTINFVDYQSLQEIILYIDGLAAYTATALVTNTGSFDPTYLDAVAAVPIKARTGAAANIVAGAAAGQMRLTGLTGMLATDVGQYVTISGAASGGNNGTFKIASFISANSVDVYNASVGTVPDANNGALAWTTGTYYEYATNFDLLDWVNSNSSLIYDDTTAYTKGAAGPIATWAQLNLSGGTRGTSGNSDWVAAFAALKSTRINQLVVLASSDATAAQGTFTIDSIVAALAAHCKLVSGTKGRNECQGWVGAAKTKSGLLALAAAQNMAHVVVTGQKVLRQKVATSAIEYFPEWAHACELAGMRAGASLGMPLTKKVTSAKGITQDASWSDQNDTDLEDLILGGVTVSQNVQNVGVQVVKCVTTYTQKDNDAFIQESLVQSWKAFSWDFRTEIDRRVTGQPGDEDLLSLIPGAADKIGSVYRDRKTITDDQDPVTGEDRNAWRDLKAKLTGSVIEVGLTITLVSGVDFTLITENFVPANLSV